MTIFSLLGDYDKVVGSAENRTKLEEMWAEQFAETLGIPVTSIYNLTITKGKEQISYVPKR